MDAVTGDVAANALAAFAASVTYDGLRIDVVHQT